MTSGTKMNWNHGLTECPSTSEPHLIAILQGGESITIKSLADSSQYHYIGSDRTVNSKTGYKLDTGETMTLTMPADFGRDNFI